MLVQPQLEHDKAGEVSVSHQGSLSGHCKAVNCVRFSPTGAGSRSPFQQCCACVLDTLQHERKGLTCGWNMHYAQAATLPALGTAGSSSCGSPRRALLGPLAQIQRRPTPAGSWQPASGVPQQCSPS